MTDRERNYAEVSSLAVRLREFLFYVIEVFAYMSYGMVIVGGTLVSFVVGYFVGLWFVGVGVFVALIIASMVLGKFMVAVRVKPGSPRKQSLVFIVSFVLVYVFLPMIFPRPVSYEWYSVLWQLALGVSILANSLVAYSKHTRWLHFYAGVSLTLLFFVTAYLLLNDLFLLSWLFAMGSTLLVYFAVAALILVKGIHVVTG